MQRDMRNNLHNGTLMLANWMIFNYISSGNSACRSEKSFWIVTECRVTADSCNSSKCDCKSLPSKFSSAGVIYLPMKSFKLKKIFQLTALIKKSCLQTLWMRTSACFIIHPRIALHESFPFCRDEWIRWKRFANCFYFSSLFARKSHNEWVSSPSAPRTLLTGSRFSDYPSSRRDCMIKAGRRIGAHKRYYSVIWRLTALSFYWVSIDLRRALVSLNVLFLQASSTLGSAQTIRSEVDFFVSGATSSYQVAIEPLNVN